MSNNKANGLNTRIVANGFVIYTKPESTGNVFIASNVDQAVSLIKDILEGKLQ